MKLITEGKCGKLGCYGRTAREVEFREYSFGNSSRREFQQDLYRFYKKLHKSGYDYATHTSSWVRGDSEDDEPIWTEYYIFPRRRDIFNQDSTGEITDNSDVRICTVRAYYQIEPKLDSFFRRFSPDGR